MWCTTRIASNAGLSLWLARVCVILSLSVRQTAAWGSSNSDTEDLSLYGNALDRDWLYDSTSISLKLEGCMWGYVEDNEDSGCMEDSSEDGTSYWYQMANCRRAQAVFSVYASSGSSTSCNKNTFKETFVTRNGLSEFIYYLQQYDANNPFGDYNANADDDAYDDDGNQGDNNYDDLPMCEQSDNGYIGLGCSSDGTFSLQYFKDAYCLQPSGTTYNKMNQLNRVLKNYKNCAGIYYYGSDNNLAQILSYNADSCSSLDSALCTDNNDMKNRRSHTSSKMARNSGGGSRSWVTKLKYVAGGMLLLASFVMFTGILFTNRRRRRALMQRKYRQAKIRDDRSRRSKRSKSSKSRRSSKSKSRRGNKSKSEGVLA